MQNWTHDLLKAPYQDDSAIYLRRPQARYRCPHAQCSNFGTRLRFMPLSPYVLRLLTWDASDQTQPYGPYYRIDSRWYPSNLWPRTLVLTILTLAAADQVAPTIRKHHVMTPPG